MSKNIFLNTPKNNSIIHDRRPQISLISINNTYYSTLSEITMFINNKKVNYKLSKNKIKYIPKKKLHSGKYTIKILLKNKTKNESIFKWTFVIESSYAKLKKYNFYFGIPHSHTSFSTGRGTPIEAFNYAFKKNLDFLIITDHSSFLCKKNKSKNKWDSTQKNVVEFSKKHSEDFLPLRGFEATSKNYGDFNVLNSKTVYTEKIRDFNKFLYWLQREDDPIVSINHPHKYIESFKYDPKLDKFINFIEVGNGSPPFKYLNGEKYYYKLLDKGWHIGAINGQDNHRINFGDTDNLTVVISKSLNKADFFKSLKFRRTYSSETRSLKLIFKVNNYWMGSIIPLDNKLNFNIIAEDKKVPISKIQIISNGGTIIKEKTSRKKTRKKFNWSFSLNNFKKGWYVVKVIHKDNRTGISSPIFI